MNNKNNQQISIGGAIIFRENRGRCQYLVVKTADGIGWEIPKVTVRKGESSVRAVIRMTSEQGGMTVRVLEEVGRLSGNTVVNGKTISQKYYFYLLMQKGMSEIIGFGEFKWMEINDAIKKVSLKKEQEMLKTSKDVLKVWEKTHSKAQVRADFELEEQKDLE